MSGVLPRVPSQLLKVGLEDLAKVEQLPGYTIDMEVWHRWNETTGKCAVCLAGAVMATRLGAEPRSMRDPDSYGWDRPALNALNWFRSGFVAQGLKCLGIPRPAEVPAYRDVSPYSWDRDEFLLDMQKLIGELEALGL